MGGRRAGPRLKSVGCGKVNGGWRGLDVRGLGSLPILVYKVWVWALRLQGAAQQRLQGYMGTRPTTRHRVPGLSRGTGRPRCGDRGREATGLTWAGSSAWGH
jgi:hypothetical protein